MSSAICFNLDQSKILSSCNGLNAEPMVLMFRSPAFENIESKTKEERVSAPFFVITCSYGFEIPKESRNSVFQ